MPNVKNNTPRIPGSPWGVAELAQFLRVAPTTVRKLIRAGKIATIKIATRQLVPDAVAQKLAAEGIGS
jgi:hypothetical protein